ncbi:MULTISPECIES: Stk1 family PASTA domain-containing Ser/Thr kinase [Bifidobacterium]|uniref:Stk1 family PASTA domain-containing Ser/Thr kinase n=1 Tax=Bifidobacterium TaxID=1678 RepID=UPI001BDD0A1B|nr:MULTISPECIES: Stk1 family PASTA domain-containing Ser/Thr kinase [Bifidobacterium]MBT1162324.1 PASTA domain-containing protein [Bifidobacterium sp. SO1]MBW3078824.1 PASTA domain-containing protein [Bifidobacterium simiiventris]
MSEAVHTPEDPLIGQMIEGRYHVSRKIAEGGMATVYEALDTRLDRTVAIKVMHMQLAQGPHRAQFVERFRREAKSAAAIANPHIVQVYDTGEVNGLDFLVMEFVHGVNLRREMNEQGTFTVRETLRVVNETLDGLASAHRAGVVHRDIKPENILLNDRGHVQITDFGLAKAASQATLSSTGMLLGTAAYLAPEMIENNQATPQGDLYSVGIMAWEMLAGEVPFTSDNPVTLVFKHVHEDVPPISTVCPGISPLVSAFLTHLTARAVEARPADAAEAEQELQQLTAQLDIADWTYRRPQGGTEQTIGSDATAAASALDALSGTSDGTMPIPAPPSIIAATSMLPATTEARTEALPDTAIASVADMDDDRSEAEKQPTRHMAKRPRSSVPVIAAAVLLVAAIAGGGAAWWYFLGPGSYWTVPKPDDVNCSQGQACSVSGARWSAYRSTLNVSNIPFTVSERNDDDVPAGDIISASPGNVGDRISKRGDASMSIVVSKGVKTATIPSDIFDTSSSHGTDVVAALESAGFDAVTHDGSQDEYSQTLPEGAAISIVDASTGDPIKAGAVLKHNTPITVVLSKGPMPVTMPDIVGKTQDEAKTALDELKLTMNVTEEYDDKVPAGSVISASVDEGSQLHWGDSVDVVVSKGPETITLENYVGQKASAAKAALEKLGFKVTVKSTITLDSNKDKLVASQDPTGGTVTRIRDENGDPITVTLTMYSSLL